jgi:proteasome assembly chaperone (PAC2) family protein
MTAITYLNHPVLKSPALVMGFMGWANAGEVSTGTLHYLQKRLSVRPLVELDPDEFYCYTEERPTTRVTSGYVEQYHVPRPLFSYALGLDDESDLITFCGPEPQLRWNSFCEAVFQVIAQTDVRVLITVGGSYDYVPHWLPPKLAAVYSCMEAEAVIAGLESVQPVNYNGPISIHTALLMKGREMDFPVIGLWGRAPMYIQTGNIKIHHAVLEVLKRTLKFTLNTDDLLPEIEDMERQVEQLIMENPKLKKYLEELHVDVQNETPILNPSTSPSENRPKGKVISLDKFLRREED